MSAAICRHRTTRIPRRPGRRPRATGSCSRLLALLGLLALLSGAAPTTEQAPAEPRKVVPLFGISNAMGTVADVEAFVWGFDFGALLRPFPDLEHAFVVSLAGQWLDSSVLGAPRGGLYFPVTFRYGGLRLGWLAVPDAWIQPGVDVIVAGGSASLAAPAAWALGRPRTELQDAFVVVEPSAGVLVPLGSWMKVGLAVAHRWPAGLDVPWLKDEDLRGLAFHGRFQLGEFGRR